jgi:hypothetical protein
MSIGEGFNYENAGMRSPNPPSGDYISPITGEPAEDASFPGYAPFDIVAFDESQVPVGLSVLAKSGGIAPFRIGGRFAVYGDANFLYLNPGSCSSGDKEDEVLWWNPGFCTFADGDIGVTSVKNKFATTPFGYMILVTCGNGGEIIIKTEVPSAEELKEEYPGAFVITIATWVSDGTTVEVLQYVESDVVFSDIPKCGESTSSSDSDSSDSDSSGSGSGSSGKSKDSAIVPVNWNSTGYAALYCVESPDVRFEDVAVFERPRGKSKWTSRWCGKFKSVVCENTMEVISYSTDSPCSLGVSIDSDGVVTFKTSIFSWLRPNRIVVKVSAIRRGFEGVRLESKTINDFAANEKRLSLEQYK